MIDLASIALRRAEEQLEAGAWKVAPREERVEEQRAPRVCAVPGCSREVEAPDGRVRTCNACREHGLVPMPCKGCGGPLRRKDQTVPNKARRSFCQACRRAMPQIQRGGETLRIVRAERHAGATP